MKLKQSDQQTLDLLQKSKNQMQVLIILSLINSKIIENGTYARSLLIVEIVVFKLYQRMKWKMKMA